MDDRFPPPHSAENTVFDKTIMFKSSGQLQKNCTTDLELENQITTLCATIAATEYQFLRLLAEYDQRGAWAGEGTRSCAHWLNWRCGINLGAAREKVRVAHALTQLPKISEAFRKGHVSYSKVRAMTRIATPELEDDLLVTAQYGSASHIEKLVRSYRHCESAEDIQQECKASNQRHYTRSLIHYWDCDCNLVIKATLPPEQGALVLKALTAATESLQQDDQFNGSQGVDEDVTDDSTADSTADSTEDTRDAASRSSAEEKSTEDVSAETSESQQSHSRDRTFDSTDDRPCNRTRARRADAMVLLATDWLNHDHSGSKSADRYQVVVNVDVDILANKTRPGTSDQVCTIDDAHAIPADTARRISCDCGVLGVITKNQQPLSIGRKSRTIPPAIRRALVRRDHGCTFPGCCATQYVEGHHIVHWANGGETSLDNLALLCTHHHRLMHEGDYTVVRNTDGRLEFYDPRGRYIDPRQAQPDDVEYRYLVHRMQSFGIDEESLWSYNGDRMDYSAAVEGMLYQRHKAA